MKENNSNYKRNKMADKPLQRGGGQVTPYDKRHIEMLGANWMNEATFGLSKQSELLATHSSMNDKFKVAGLTEALRQDESFSACLEILQLENSDYTQLPAHYRLLLPIVAAAMKQNAINTFIEK